MHDLDTLASPTTNETTDDAAMVATSNIEIPDELSLSTEMVTSPEGT